MNSWPSATLDDLYAEPSRNGLTRPRSVRGIGYRMINMGEIFSHERIGDIEMERVQMTEKEVASFAVKKGDLLFARQSLVLAGAGKCSIVKSVGETTTFESHLIRVRLNANRADPRFFFYYFISPRGKQNVQSIVMQVAAAGIRGSELAKLEVPVPPLPMQRRIASVLSAYDELMENCQRRIRILEEMSRALYREWFVHFRFPGHEKLPRVASLLGDIPKGWEIRMVKDVATVTYGFPFQSKKFNTDGTGTPVIRIRDILEGSITTFTDEDAAPKYHIKNGDILVGMDGDFHMCIWSSGHALQNQRVAKFESRGEIGNYHLFLALAEPIQTWNKSIVGTTVAHLGDMHIKTIQFAWPPDDLLARAREVLEPMSEQIIALKRRIANLRRTRDLLLPRLLSGQVSLDVSAVEDVAEPTAPAPPRSQVALGNALPGEVALRAGGVSAGGRTDSHPQTPPPCEVKLRSESHSQVQLGNEEPEEEPALRAAEEAPPYRVERAGPGLPPPAEPADEAPVPIDQIDRTEVLQVIRQVFSEGPPRERDDAIRDVARALGYRRTGARIHEILHTDLLTAVRRGILENNGGELRLLARSITDYERDFLKQQFLAAIGRPWIDRDTATRDFCRWLGFARTGPVIEDTARSLINGLLREGRLEADGAELIRRVS
jgi:type I restriction enzyme S subunit